MVTLITRWSHIITLSVFLMRSSPFTRRLVIVDIENTYVIGYICLTIWKDNFPFLSLQSEQTVSQAYHILIECSFSNKLFSFSTIFVDRFSGLTEDFACNYILPKYLSLYGWTKSYLGIYSFRESRRQSANSSGFLPYLWFNHFFFLCI